MMLTAGRAPSVGVVIVAAGAGSRLGGVAKALLECDGRTYLAAILANARDAGATGAIVVVGPPFGAAVAAHALREPDVEVIVNPAPERGMASSIALGFAAALARSDMNWDAAWLWPVDHPAVRADTLRQICAAFDLTNAHAVARPRYHGRGGHPPLVGRGRWLALSECASAPEGARAVLRSEDTVDVEVDDPGVIRDIDTPDDLAIGARP